MIDTSDARFTRALELADGAAQWLKCRTTDGKKAYGVPSSKGNGRYYLTTCQACTCYDAQRRVCKHMQAVAIHVARVRGSERPAADVLDGLEQMVADRHPTLDLVRHDNGAMTWRPAPTYDSVFSRFGEI